MIIFTGVVESTYKLKTEVKMGNNLKKGGLKALIGQRLNAVSANIEAQEITFHGEASESKLTLPSIPETLFWGLLASAVKIVGCKITTKKLTSEQL